MTQPHEQMQEQRLKCLRRRANWATSMNYAPYSGFCVLAAIETIPGFVIQGHSYYGGSNIENAAFNPSVHAEQSALIAARAGWCAAHWSKGDASPCPQHIVTAIYVRSRTAVTPCGHCRQFLSEFVSPGCLWISESDDGNVLRSGLFADLLPEAFSGYKE